jgi:hypothetical protein
MWQVPPSDPDFSLNKTQHRFNTCDPIHPLAPARDRKIQRWLCVGQRRPTPPRRALGRRAAAVGAPHGLLQRESPPIELRDLGLGHLELCSRESMIVYEPMSRVY